MKALYIGRFQPFHNGHLSVMQWLSRKYDEVIVGIGSSQDRDTSENPFSEEERVQMITRSLDAMGIHRYRVIAIPDIHNPPQWVAHVRGIVPDFDVVITNNPFTRSLFIDKGYPVESTPYFQRSVFSGKEIRRRMLHDESWDDLVPTAVHRIIQDINGVQRVKEIARSTTKK
jgi:nicotinamide-nucleotide adenylyltransferase